MLPCHTRLFPTTPRDGESTRLFQLITKPSTTTTRPPTSTQLLTLTTHMTHIITILLISRSTPTLSQPTLIMDTQSATKTPTPLSTSTPKSTPS